LSGDPSIVLKQRRVAFENSRFRVFSDHIVDSYGAEVRDYLVVSPHTRREDLITGISVLPVSERGVVLLKIFRHAVGKVQLEVPRGFVDRGEDPRAAALRELSEEAGMRCEPDKLISLGVCAPEGSTLAARVALFAATDCLPAGGQKENELGLGECVHLTWAEALLLLREMSIEDVTTCVTLHRFFLLRDPGVEG